jgi:DNA-binding SARP family transcriptional activator/LysM repeat protein
VSTLTRILRGLAAVVVLAALLVGLPVAMLTVLDADPRRLWPDDLPPMNELREYLWFEIRSAWDTGELVVYLLIIVGWAAWLALVWITVVEVAYQTRYGPELASDRHHARSPRRWIAGLVASVLLLGSAAPALAEPGPTNQMVTTAPRHPGGATVLGASVDTSASMNAADIAEPISDSAQCTRVRVVLGDTLWGLAERHLGNGARYTEIVTLNHDRLSPGGPQHLEPGWALLLPPDATNLPDSTATECDDDRTVKVRTGDTLSAIAARELGDPKRWQELFEANHRRPQADGRALLDPDIILPGWSLRVPVTSPNGDTSEHPSTRQPAEEPETPENDPPQPERESRGDTADSDKQAGAPEQRPDAEPVPDQGTGVSLPSGAYVGLGLAALITIAMMTVWIWRRRTWVPGSWRPDDLRMPPVVRAMRIAHDIGTLPRDRDGDLLYPPQPADRPRELGVIDRALGTAVMLRPAAGETVIGVADGRPVALDRARAKGLGLTGPGAPSAARALIVDLLAQGQNPELDAPLLVMPRDDAATVLDNDENSAHPPRRLHLTSSLTAALDWLEAELLTRTRDEVTDRRQAPLVLVAHVDDDHTARLSAILEAGVEVGLAAVLLGPWPPGVTIDVRPDGTVRQSSGHSDLAGARLFNLPTSDARDLLDILGAADATTDPEATRSRIDEQELEIAARDDADPIPAYTPFIDDPPPQPSVEVPLRKARPSPSPATNPEAAPLPRMRMNVLGQTSLTYRDEHGDETPVDVLQPKQWEVLTYLALHPNGARRDALIATIWPEAPNDRPANPFHAQLYQIRAALRRTAPEAAVDPISARTKIYRLDPDVVDVDLWRVQEALHVCGQNGDRSEAVETITAHYSGPVAPDLAPSWLEVHREQLHRQVLAILYAHTRDLHDQPDHRLALLEHIRSLDPRTEGIYREIASAQAELGQHAAIDHTLRLLTANLAEIDEEPSSDFITYLNELQRSRSDVQPD